MMAFAESGCAAVGPAFVWSQGFFACFMIGAMQGITAIGRRYLSDIKPLVDAAGLPPHASLVGGGPVQHGASFLQDENSRCRNLNSRACFVC